MEKLLNSLRKHYPTLDFTAGDMFCWSPQTKEIIYKDRNGVSEHADWSLLHETAHALLGHQTYSADIELVKIEMAAWQKAKELGKEFDIVIDEDHIENCLDTYRDWLYRRSICPVCTTKCLQQKDIEHYRCFNCHTIWKVSPSRLCRSYRSIKNNSQPISVFHASEEMVR
jgi:hypothetical protein